jgi:multisubunit Na+/H+ antiporter MnhB subunit
MLIIKGQKYRLNLSKFISTMIEGLLIVILLAILFTPIVGVSNGNGTMAYTSITSMVVEMFRVRPQATEVVNDIGTIERR